VCRTTISGTFETGQTAVRIDLIDKEGESAARLQMFLPVGLYLQSGVKLTVDQGSAYRVPYMWCLTNTCIAADLADPKLIKEMETGQKLLLEVVDSSVLAASTSLPLNQFSTVHQGTPAQTFEQAIDE
jgi:invasion protein IalB